MRELRGTEVMTWRRLRAYPPFWFWEGLHRVMPAWWKRGKGVRYNFWIFVAANSYGYGEMSQGRF